MESAVFLSAGGNEFSCVDGFDRGAEINSGSKAIGSFRGLKRQYILSLALLGSGQDSKGGTPQDSNASPALEQGAGVSMRFGAEKRKFKSRRHRIIVWIQILFA